MIETVEASLESFDDFSLHLRARMLVFFHVYEVDCPEVGEALETATPRDERLLRLDVHSDRGFLANTVITVDILRPSREFVQRPLLELRGLGAWTKGTMVFFESDPEKWPVAVEKACAFAFPGRDGRR